MDLIRLLAGSVLAIAVFCLLLPATASKILDGINPTVSRHTVVCDVLIQRELGDPRIASYSCENGGTCGGLEAMDFLGDYRGNLELSLDGKATRTSFTIGLGIPLAPANKQVVIKKCMADGDYAAQLTVYDGSGNGILNRKDFQYEVS